MVLHDYFRLYITEQTQYVKSHTTYYVLFSDVLYNITDISLFIYISVNRFDIPTVPRKKWWRFAVKIEKQQAQNKNLSFRCIVCSQEVHGKGISFMPQHLKACPMMKTSKAEDIYNATLKMGAPINNPVQQATGKTEAMKGFYANLELAQQISLASNQANMLSTILDNIKHFAEIVFSMGEFL